MIVCLVTLSFDTVYIMQGIWLNAYILSYVDTLTQTAKYNLQLEIKFAERVYVQNELS